MGSPFERVVCGDFNGKYPQLSRTLEVNFPTGIEAMGYPSNRAWDMAERCVFYGPTAMALKLGSVTCCVRIFHPATFTAEPFSAGCLRASFVT